jgi:methanogenic corrinoid protein MtbC1
MVGGRVFDEQPQLVARVGADASAADAREAPRIAELLL